MFISIPSPLSPPLLPPQPLTLPPSLTPSPKPHTAYSDRISATSHPLSARLLSIMDDKKTNLALSADVQTSKKLLEVAETTVYNFTMISMFQ